MISIRRVSMGGGYRYLINSVAAGDGNPEPSKGLAHYYASTGTPPGVFLGAGLADLDGGKGVEKGSQVSEEHLFNMLGKLSDPVSGEPLGGRLTVPGNAAPVAGFDLTFSPSKCVSTAWALADEDTKAVIVGLSPPSDRLRPLLRRITRLPLPLGCRRHRRRGRDRGHRHLLHPLHEPARRPSVARPSRGLESGEISLGREVEDP